MKEAIQDMPWKDVMFRNFARPKAIHTLWRACHNSLPTKERLLKFGLIDNQECGFCRNGENLNHIFFLCHGTRIVWESVLEWLQVQHHPQQWDSEILWLTGICKRKSWKNRIIQCAFTETIYECWRLRNAVCFGEPDSPQQRIANIVNTTVLRCWSQKNIRPYLGRLMLP
ncbi:uncharacterized protein LOC131605813 [Vicia villosa]|uniref:uncharacterized protein LOC131605813 n=1 Tax=Vicia villosa TaxID=3911 RepID=UPI00273B685A|nr:uncharacterized protein LOC131605813 [Vicia villosa]